MERSIGSIATIRRYPVKSMAGEDLAESRVERYGLFADRSHALQDDSKTDELLTARQVKELFHYQPRFQQEQAVSDEFPPLVVASPTGVEYAWGDDRLKAELEELAGRPLTLIRKSPVHDPIMAVDEAHLLIVTEASLQALSREWGKPLDELRFRPNIVINGGDETEAYEEQGWVGKRLAVGEVLVEVESLCPRCVMVTIEPETLDKDASLLKLIAKEHQTYFGAYARVILPGTIRRGDVVRLMVAETGGEGRV